MDQLLEAFLLHEGWIGSVKWSDVETPVWVAPDDWLKQGILTSPKEAARTRRKPTVPTGDNYKSQFNMVTSPGKGNSKDFFWLTQLLGIGDHELGLHWVRNGVGARPWRKAVGQQSKIIARLRAHGFEYLEDDGSFFLPVRVDQSTLAHAVSDESPKLALAPLSDALQACVKAKPDLDALLDVTDPGRLAATIPVAMPNLLPPEEVA
jgi:hypothetical protein